MAFASLQDIGDRLGRPLSSSEQTTVNLLLDTATAVVANAAGKDDDWAAALDPIPQLLRALTIEVVCRAFANPSSLDSMQENIGAYSYSARFREVGLLLSPAERSLINEIVYGSSSGSARMESIFDDVVEYAETGEISP